jgi:hypothetical protein
MLLGAYIVYLFLNPNLIAANLIAAKAPFSRAPPSGQGWVG